MKSLFSLLILLSMVLAACGGAPTEVPPPQTGGEIGPPTELPTPSQRRPTAPREEPTGPPEQSPPQPPPLNLNVPLPESAPDVEISLPLAR